MDNFRGWPRKRLGAIALAAVLAASAFTVSPAESGPRYFASPDEAAAALADAAKAGNQNAILDILGDSYREWILSGDSIVDNQAVQRFADAYAQKFSLGPKGANRVVLTVGTDDFPFPFPLVSRRGRWAFDAEAGKEELLTRRIGENELDTIEVLRAVVDAQREYAARDRDDDGAPDYATKFISSPGKRDGLYWPTAEGKPESPLGPLVGEATREGYGGRSPNRLRPYKGYYYRLLLSQGRNAPGGAYDYIAKGKLIGGFAVVAHPARYGISGIKTFMVSHDGVVYEADFGPSTPAAVAKMSAFNPDKRWKPVALAE